MIKRALQLDNGMIVQQIGGVIETRAIYREVFVDDVYLRGGVKVTDGDIVIDVGANIGMFALRMLRGHRRLTLVAIEPVPALYSCLQDNVAAVDDQAGHQVFLENVAAGAAAGEACFHFYPRATAFSTMHPAERERLSPFVLNDLLSHYPTFQKRFPVLGALLFPFRRLLMKAIIWRRMRDAQPVQCRVRPLSAIIAERGLLRVDLLKIDVEGAELDVLRGIDDDHWPMIQQLAVEVQDLDGRLVEIEAMLQSHGFAQQLVVPSLTEDAATPVRLLYARR
jgi:31-O-methyltransferase